MADQALACKRIVRLALILSVIWMSRFLVYNLRMVQVTPFPCFGSPWKDGIRQATRKVDGRLGGALGIGMKILPVLLLPGWLVKAKWKPVLWTAVFVGAWMVLPC